MSAPDVATAEREARHYWIQYFDDGEYQKHLSNDELSHAEALSVASPLDV